MTQTSPFGVGNREAHDSAAFNALRAMTDGLPDPYRARPDPPTLHSNIALNSSAIIHGDATAMPELLDGSVGLIVTSPPYNVGKTYDQDMSLTEWADMLYQVFVEGYRVLVDGGRLVVNVANVGRSPYVRLTDIVSTEARTAGFMPLGEIIWQKAQAASGNCAWGSWLSAKSPVLRDVHEYILVFGKGKARPDKGVSSLTPDTFMQSTTSVWSFNPESAKRVGHPAPFPVELPYRVINLYSYVPDVVLDPFGGSGTTAVAAHRAGRRWLLYVTSADYVELARARLERLTGVEPLVYVRQEQQDG